MRRRDFLTVTGGAVGTAGATGTAAAASGAAGPAQQSGTTTDGEAPTGGGTETVAVGPGGRFVFEPESITVTPGTTVRWEWESDFHNVVVSSQPEGANWEGTPGDAATTYDTGYTYEFEFTTTGTYEYVCAPHESQGMVGEVVVSESGGTEGGQEELSPHEMGVPFQAHFVGIATVVMMVVTLVYTFFVLKYGESRHANGGRN